MSQRENATGIDPAARRAEPSLRAEIVAVTWREIPCMTRYPVTRTVMTAPEKKAELSATGSESVNVATGSSLVARLVANCGCVLPFTVIVVRSTRKRPLVTWSPATTIAPLTALVRPTTSLLNPRALSLTRKPATDPEEASQVPPSGPDGAAQWFPGSGSGAALGPSEEAFLTAYAEVTGQLVDYPGVQAAAGAVIAAYCARRAGTTARGRLWAQAVALDTVTLLGGFRIDPVSGAQVGHEAALVRWTPDGLALA